MYRSGTVTIIQGEKSVVGVGTLWVTVANVQAGYLITFDGVTDYVITSVTDDEHIAIEGVLDGGNFAEASIVNGLYAIRIPASMEITGVVAAKLLELQNLWHQRERDFYDWMTSTAVDFTFTDFANIAHTIPTPFELDRLANDLNTPYQDRLDDFDLKYPDVQAWHAAFAADYPTFDSNYVNFRDVLLVNAQTSESNALTYRNEAQSARDAAVTSSSLSQDYANAAYNTLVEAGKYSSAHWAEASRLYAVQAQNYFDAGGGDIWLDGVGVPANTLGDDRDFYIDTAVGNIYRKFSGVWQLLFSTKGDKGNDGQGLAAKSLVVTADSQTFSYDKDGVLFGNTSVTITANAQNLAGSTSWSTVPANVGTSAGTTYTISSAQFGANDSVKVTASRDGYSDTTTIVRLSDGVVGADGVSPITIVLSNQAHTIPAANDGTVTSFAGSGTDLRVYEGTTLLTYDGAGATNGTWKVLSSVVDAVTKGALSDGGAHAVFANITAMSADAGTITYTVNGTKLDGTAFTSSPSVQTFTKAREGVKGETGEQGVQGLTASDIVGIPGQVWGFKGGQTFNWIGGDATLSAGTDSVIITPTAADQRFLSPDNLGIVGADNYAVRVKVRCTSHTITNNAQFYYETSDNASHVFHGDYRKELSVNWVQGVYQYLVFDMRELTFGGNDFITSTIKRLRFDFAQSNTQIFEVDGVVIGYFGAADVTDYDAPSISNNSIIENNLVGAGKPWVNLLPEDGATENGATSLIADSTFSKNFTRVNGGTPHAFIDPTGGEFGDEALVVNGDTGRSATTYFYFDNSKGLHRFPAKIGDNFIIRARLKATAGMNDFFIKVLGYAGAQGQEYLHAIDEENATPDGVWKTVEGRVVIGNATTTQVSFYGGVSALPESGQLVIDTVEAWKIPAGVSNALVNAAHVGLDLVDNVDSLTIRGEAVNDARAHGDLANNQLTATHIRDGAGWTTLPANDATRNTGALADLNSVDLANPSRVTGLLGSANADTELRNANITASNIRAGAGWATLPADAATRNTGALADLNSVDLANPSRVTGLLGSANADTELRNANITASNIRAGAGWATLPADAATRNTGALADLNSVDLANPSRVTGLLGSANADTELRNANTQWSELNNRPTDAQLLNDSGAGFNFFNPDYQNPDEEVPHIPNANVNATTTIQPTFDYGQPSGGSVFRIEATANDAFLTLSPNSTTYGTRIIRNKKWIFSAYVYAANSQAANKSVQLYVKTPFVTGTFYAVTATTGANGTWKRISGIINLEADDSDTCYFRLDNDGGAGAIIIYDHLMFEVSLDGANIPSEYRPPLKDAPVNPLQLPIVAITGTGSASSDQYLSSIDEGSTASIDIATHEVQFPDKLVSYNSGGLSGHPYDTPHYVYCDDYGFNGGNVTYVSILASQLKTLAAKKYRRYVGKITTDTAGGTGTFPDPGDCVDENMWLTHTLQAKDAQAGDIIDVWDDGLANTIKGRIQSVSKSVEACIELTTTSGCQVINSLDTPVTRHDGSTFKAANALGEIMFVIAAKTEYWDQVIKVRNVGLRNVVHISVGNISFAAGVTPNNRVITHNSEKP